MSGGWSASCGREHLLTKGALLNAWGRIYLRLAQAGDCLVFTGSRGTSGYGQIGCPPKLILQPHRISWAYHNGPIPAGALVLHRCDNRVCCNPAHLFLGTHKQNTQDAISKGRFAPGPFPRGDKHYNTKIPDSEIQVIREARASGIGQRKLAKKYGVSKTQIARIERGESRA